MLKVDENKKYQEDMKRSVYDKLKFSNLVAERDVKQTMKPSEILVKAKFGLAL